MRKQPGKVLTIWICLLGGCLSFAQSSAQLKLTLVDSLMISFKAKDLEDDWAPSIFLKEDVLLLELADFETQILVREGKDFRLHGIYKHWGTTAKGQLSMKPQGQFLLDDDHLYFMADGLQRMSLKDSFEVVRVGGTVYPGMNLEWGSMLGFLPSIRLENGSIRYFGQVVPSGLMKYKETTLDEKRKSRLQASPSVRTFALEAEGQKAKPAQWGQFGGFQSDHRAFSNWCVYHYPYVAASKNRVAVSSCSDDWIKLHGADGALIKEIHAPAQFIDTLTWQKPLPFNDAGWRQAFAKTPYYLAPYFVGNGEWLFRPYTVPMGEGKKKAKYLQMIEVETGRILDMPQPIETTILGEWGGRLAVLSSWNVGEGKAVIRLYDWEAKP